MCGLTSVADAEAAAQAGASYLGVVFADGPRRIRVDQAGPIVQAAGALPVIGVFADQSVEAILEISAASGLSGVQLHGSYGRSEAAALRRAGLIVWRVVRVAIRQDLELLPEATHDADAVLVEPRVSHALGGAGVPLDLAIAIEARARLGGHPMVLAGGLAPETVERAVALVRPEVVDVSSGIESLPGRKDPEKIARFMEAVCGHSARA